MLHHQHVIKRYSKEKFQVTKLENRAVSREEGMKYARKHSMLFIEASAKTCDGVQCAFEELVEKILQTPGLWESESPQGFSLTDLSNKSESSCSGYCTLI
ncbi:ras-related protein Rab-18 [Trichonephila clavata]|uniref:Ras-related protein Rab-18 n=1 Tax=Trichonephila clavata TaxID=2740835 RepID=A0A8X6HIR9_TRICU|nr:ras-related protein Rab-18 [Trichonephila clavata]